MERSNLTGDPDSERSVSEEAKTKASGAKVKTADDKMRQKEYDKRRKEVYVVCTYDWCQIPYHRKESRKDHCMRWINPKKTIKHCPDFDRKYLAYKS